MSDSGTPKEVLDIVERYGKILVPILRDCTERAYAIDEVVEVFGRKTARLTATRPSERTGVEKKLARTYFYGAGANTLYSFSQDVREAHQQYTMTMSQYVDTISRLLEELRPFDPIYARVVWEKTFGGETIVTRHREWLEQVRAFHEA